MKNYDHKTIEKKWQKVWSEEKIYQTKDNSKKPKYYILDMFPYPSGEGLHVGHPKGYIATDIMSRMKRMQGYNVLHPIGFDAFGLPAENYAIKNKINPEVAVKKNVLRFKKQLEIIGLDYDWSREINTTDPSYYKWTQFIFLKMLEKGLAYQSYEPINWCPSCKTGLANEDLEDGKCERCGSEIEQKPMRQWVLKITDYAERLLKDLDLLDWPESIKESQRNWIGKSEGSEIEFKIVTKPTKNYGAFALGGIRQGTHDALNSLPASSVKVFTTRADTLFGATYVVLAPEHELLEKLKNEIENWEEVEKYIKKVKNKTNLDRTENKEKTGIELKGVKAINPADGEEIPVWIADYVLASYGTGAVMAVPAHDERDFEFAKKYNLPIKRVVEPKFVCMTGPSAVDLDKDFIPRNAICAIVRNPRNDNYLCLSWKEHYMHGLVTGGVEEGEDIVDAAIREVHEETGYKNLKFVKNPNFALHSHFYHRVKNQNRAARFQYIFLDLINEERDEVSEEEKKVHEAVWVPKRELNKFFTVVEGEFINRFIDNSDYIFTEDGVLYNSGNFNNLDSEEARKKITEFVGGKIVTKYKLRDWVFSRQRYWGEPIPVLHDGDKIIPVKEKDLPVILPKVKSYEPTGTGESPLAAISKWVNIKDKKGKILKRETNTMPQWAGSSWYYLRYMDPKNRKSLVDKNKEKYWNQVDFYVGGAEHATRHLIYARFWHKFLYDIGIVSTKEPFKKLQSVGLIIGEDGKKMSKRFGNVVNPDDIVSLYGADTLRLYEMFLGPFDQVVSWNMDSIIGPRRFLEKVWRISLYLKNFSGPRVARTKILEKNGLNQTIQNSSNREILRKLLHKTIKKVGEDIENMHFNTAISSMMILATEMETFVNKGGKIDKEDFLKFLKILSPFAPYVTEELWFNFGNKKSIHVSPWPSFDKELIKDDEIKIMIQINGKVRGEIVVSKDTEEDEIKKIVLKNEKILTYLNQKEIKKFIYVKNRIVSIVI